jgi:hypothetical protein
MKKKKKKKVVDSSERGIIINWKREGDHFDLHKVKNFVCVLKMRQLNKIKLMHYFKLDGQGLFFL